jgi:hypothetical protein
MCIHHCDIPSISISAKKTRCWESGLRPGLSVKGDAFGFCSHQQIVLQWNPQSVSLYSENAKKLSVHQLWVRREYVQPSPLTILRVLIAPNLALPKANVHYKSLSKIVGDGGNKLHYWIY